MHTSNLASAPCRLPSGAHRRLRRARSAAAGAHCAMRLVTTAVVLVSLALGLSVAVRGASHSLQTHLAASLHGGR